MKNKLIQTYTSPYKYVISFHKLFEKIRNWEVGDHCLLGNKSGVISKNIEALEFLREGVPDVSELEAYQEDISNLISLIIPAGQKSLKYVGTSPMDLGLHASKEIMRLKEKALVWKIQVREDLRTPEYIMDCMAIMTQYYKLGTVDVRNHKLNYQSKTGDKRTYKVDTNYDFIEFIPTEKSVELMEADFELLLNSMYDIDVWKSKFPEGSWLLKGFKVFTLHDITEDELLSDFKDQLNTNDQEGIIEGLRYILQRMYGIPDLDFGITIHKAGNLEQPHDRRIRSFLLDESESLAFEEVMCPKFLQNVVLNQQIFSISDILDYEQGSGSPILAQNMKRQGIQSAIFAPIMCDGDLLGIFGLSSKSKGALNSINALKLESLMPHIASFLKGNIEAVKFQLDAIIQRECTSIHPSVYWRFEKEALQFLNDQQQKGEARFNEIVFEEVYPLFGQVDVRGSSLAQNTAISRDLLKQLDLTEELLESALRIKYYDILEEKLFGITSLREMVNNEFTTDTEQSVERFYHKEIMPILDMLDEEMPELHATITDFKSSLHQDSFLIYDDRKKYDQTIQIINQRLSTFMDEAQKEAQDIFPHYFEKYMTDGLEHSMYVGQSLTKQTFNTNHLKSLRIWQIKVLCQLEAEFRRFKNKLPIPLEVASMMLAFSSPITIRYKMDEKQFDVDGAYNVRYEIIKKRIDKSRVKRTGERLTQPGKLAIVYSSPMEGEEYSKYLSFLVQKGYLTETIEVLELEELQGVKGLRALRVEIAYDHLN